MASSLSSTLVNVPRWRLYLREQSWKRTRRVVIASPGALVLMSLRVAWGHVTEHLDMSHVNTWHDDERAVSPLSVSLVFRRLFLCRHLEISWPCLTIMYSNSHGRQPYSTTWRLLCIYHDWPNLREHVISTPLSRPSFSMPH